MRTPWIRALTVLTLCVLWMPAVQAEDEPTPFGDAKLLEKHLGPACDMVEAICGAKFAKRPTVRVSDAETVAKLLVSDLADLPEEVLAEADREATAELLAKFLLAKYDTAGHVIHVLPKAVARLLEAEEKQAPLGLDHMRLLLVHEATHALDFTRYDLVAERGKRTTADEHQALGAVVEGHAQWVTQQAAKRWKLEDAFRQLTYAIVGVPDEDRDATLAAVLSQLTFTYTEGFKFFQAVAKARGDEGVDAALRNPPRTTREIERPATYLDPTSEKAIDLRAAADTFRPLVAHEAWSVQSQRMLEVALRTQAARVPADRRKEFLRGYVDSHVLIGTVEGEDLQVLALVVQFDTPENAQLFAELERLVVENAKGDPPRLTFETKALGDGVGTGGKRTGFHMHRVVTLGPQEINVHQQVLVVGRMTCELMAVNVPGMDRAAMDPVVDYVAAVLENPAAAKTLKKPAVFPFESSKRKLTVRVLTPDGKPVPMALVTIRTTKGNASHSNIEPCPGGEHTLRLDKGPATLSAARATDEDGAPLNYAPSEPVDVADDTRTVELRLQPGLTIAGRVVDVDGGPAVGVFVQARSMRLGPGAGAPNFQTAQTQDDGTFEIVGLQEGTTYRLVVTEDPEPFAEGQAFPDHDAGATDVELRLEKLDTVEVTVVDPDGKPVRGAHVSAHPRGGGRAPGAVTNERGVARIKGLDPKKTFRLEVEVNRFAGRDDLSHYEQRRWKPEDTRVELAPGWTLRGVVVDADGKPVAGKLFRKTGPGGWTSSPTRRDGSFEVRGLSGPAEVAAQPADAPHDHMRTEMMKWTTIEPTKERVELPMAAIDESGLVRIRVLDTDGNPVTAITMRYGSGDIDDPFGSTSTTSASARDGLFRIKRPTKRFHIRVYKARTFDSRPLPLAPLQKRDVDPGVEELVFRLPKGRVLTGVVTTAKGQPIGGVEVLALPRGTESWERGHWEAHGIAKTKSDGTYELISLGEQPYRLRAIPPKPHVEPELVPVGASDTTADIRLVGSIDLVIRNWREEAVAGARVEVVRVEKLDRGEHREQVFEGRTNSSGTVSMRSFEGDLEHRLVVEPPDRATDLLQRVVNDWDGKAGTVTLPRGYVISGLVKDAKGPVAKAAIRIRTPDGSWGHVARTDAEGRFNTQLLPWKPADVRAERDTDDVHADVQETAIERVGPDEPWVALTMKPRTAELRLRLKEAKKGWSGWVVRKDAGRTAFEFEADGVTVVKDLAAGTYSIYVPHPDDEKRCAYVTGVVASKGETALALEATRPFTFRVAPPQGSSSRVTAFIRGPAFERFDARKGRDGLYVVEGLPPGTWMAVAFVKVGQAWFEGSAKTDGGKPPTVTPKAMD